MGSFRKLYPAFESNIPFELRMMVDLNIPGCGWIEMPPGKYKMRNPNLVLIFFVSSYYFLASW